MKRKSSLTEKNKAAVDQCLKAFLNLQKVDPLFATQFIHELSFALRDPHGFIEASDPTDRDDARALLFGLRSGR